MTTVATQLATPTVVPVVQPKLTVGPVDDPLEREADEIADRVMRMPADAFADAATPPDAGVDPTGRHPVVRRCPGACPTTDERRDEPVLRRCCGGGPNDVISRRRTTAIDDDPRVLRAARRPGLDGDAPALDHDTATAIDRHRGAGKALEPGTRHHFERGLGVDLSAVRVHTGCEAAALASRVHARAFTVGTDVFFGPSEYRPSGVDGRRLLAHEVAHTMQQSGVPPATERRTAQPKDGAAALVQRASAPAPEDARPPADLRCAATTDGGSDGAVVDFGAGSATVPIDLPSLTEFASSWHAMGGTDEVVITGYASAEGSADYNWHLSCDRALSVADALSTLPDEHLRIERGFLIPQASGETDRFSDALPENRRVVIATPFTTSPIPAAPSEGAPAAQPCWDVEQMATELIFGSQTAVDLFVDVVECACLVIKFLDVTDDVLAKFIPLFGTEAVQKRISRADFLCTLWDLLQLIHKYGTKDDSCFDLQSITWREWGWVGAFGVTMGLDLISDKVAAAFVTLTKRAGQAALFGGGTSAGAGGGTTAGSPGGPPGAAVGGTIGAEVAAAFSAVGVGVTELVSLFAAEDFKLVSELAVDLITMGAQEWIAHGTVVPYEGLGACRDLFNTAMQVGEELRQGFPPPDPRTVA